MNKHHRLTSVCGFSLALSLLIFGYFLFSTPAAKVVATAQAKQARETIALRAASRVNPWINGRDLLKARGLDALEDLLLPHRPVIQPKPSSQNGSPLPNQLANDLLGAKLEQTAALGDFNGDGIMDVAVADFLGDAVVVMVGDQAGNFHSATRLPSGSGPRSVVACDFNRDGMIDLAVANFFSGDVAVFLAQGDGNFQPLRSVKLAEGLTSMVGGDFDTDGRLDLAVANFLSGKVVILKGDGDGSFTTSSIGQAWASTLILSCDPDRNGLLDLVAIDASGKDAQLFIGRSNESFQDGGKIDPATAISSWRDRKSANDRILQSVESRAIRKLSGDGQSAPVGTASGQPLVVEVGGQNDLWRAGEPVVFSKLYGDARLEENNARITDEQGQASLALSPGELPGTNLIAVATSGGQVTVFGESSTLSSKDFFERIRAGLIQLPLAQSDLRKQHALLDEAEQRLSTGDEIGLVTKLKDSIELLADIVAIPFGERRSVSQPVDLLKRLLNQTLLFGSASPASLTATISCGETKTGNLASPGQQDTYTFAGNGGEAVVVSAIATSGALCAHVQVLTQTGLPIGSQTCNTDSSVIILPSTGIYTIVVSDFVSSNRTGTYDLNLQFVTGRCGSLITCGQTLGGSLASKAEQDALTFQGKAGEVVVVSAVATSGDLCAHAQVYTPTGVAIGSQTCNTSSGVITLPSTGTYTIIIHDNLFSGRAGNYDLNLVFATGRCGTSISCGQTISWNMTSKAQQEAFTFCGVAGSSVVISTAATSGNICAHAQVYTPTGVAIGSQTCNTSSGVITLPSTGTYTIIVNDFLFSGRTGTYNLGLSCTGNSCSSPPDFTLTCSPSSVSVPQGGFASSVCTVTSLNGFSNPVSFDVSGLVPGLQVGFTSQVTPPPNGTVNNQVRVGADPSVPLGPLPQPVQIIGTSGSLRHPFGLTVTVTSGQTMCPTLSNLNPTSGSLGVAVTITGSNFTGVNAVKFSNNVSANFTINSNTQITTTVPSGVVTGPIIISKPNCADVQTSIFTVAIPSTLPTVTTTATTAITSTSATLNGSVNPNGSATNISFEWGANSTLASFNTTPTQAVGSGTTSVTVSAGLSGLTAGTSYYYRLAGTNSAGTAKGAILSFTTLNPVPTVASLNPNSASAGGTGFTLTVNGRDFVNGSVVRWNGSNRATTFISSTQLTAAILAGDLATAGTASLTVFNPAPGGGTSNALTFTINRSITVTLTATPTTVPPGGQLTVSWTAAGGQSALDWIGLFKVGDPNTIFSWWRYTNGAPSGSFVLNAPTQAGQYEFRYLLNDGYTDVARSNIVTVGVAGTYTLTATPNSVAPGSQVTICWTATSGRSTTDWIGLYRVGDPNTVFSWWRYTDGAPSGCFTLPAPTQAGQYEFRYLLQDGYTDVARSNIVTVESLSFTVTAAPNTITPGAQLTVSWTAASGRSALDWIGLFKVGDPNTIFSWWRYTDGASSGSFVLNAPTQAGQYEFRYLLNDGYVDVARSNAVIVRNEAATWSVTQRNSVVEIAYGGGTDFPQYAALHLNSSYFRLNYGPGSGWGTSVILLPSFWERGTYYQGEAITASWRVDGEALMISFTGAISGLRAQGQLRLMPPGQNVISAQVTVSVEGNVELDPRSGEAFKPVMLSSMHISSDSWDAQTAYIASLSFPIPGSGWVIYPPATSNRLVAMKEIRRNLLN